MEPQEERWCAAEVARLRGVWRLRQTGTPAAEAETWRRRALDVTHRQEAKSWELRAPIYGWLTEGFDTADLQEAKALLETLS